MNDHKDKKSRFKKPGSILATTLVAAIVWIMIAQAMFVVSSGQFKMIKSSRVALQAQQYAEITVDTLKNINYDELDTEGAHSRQSIKGIAESSDWEDEVTIGAESTIAGSDDVKQRIATVNVYKKGDTLPRFTLEVPLSSKGSGSVLPVGSVIAWASQTLPDKKYGIWLECNGQQFSSTAYPELYYILGTSVIPDCRGKFLEGADVPNQIIEAGLPNIVGSYADRGFDTDGIASGAFRIGSGMMMRTEHGDSTWHAAHSAYFNAAFSSPIYGKSDTVQPSAVTVKYIIKAK